MSNKVIEIFWVVHNGAIAALLVPVLLGSRAEHLAQAWFGVVPILACVAYVPALWGALTCLERESDGYVDAHDVR